MQQLKINKLSDSYMMINMIKNEVSVIANEEVIKKYVYTLVGIDLTGKRDFLGFYIDKKNDNRFFLELFETIKNKGINRIYYFISNDDGRIKRALNISFPNTIIVTNLTLNINSLWKYISFRSRNELISKIKKLYIQDNYDKANILIKCLKEEYKDNILLLLLFEKYFNDIEKYYQYDIEVRKFLFNHNSFTDLYDKIKSISKEKVFIDENNIYEELKKYIELMEKNRLYNKNNWCNILNHCSKYFPNLLDEVTKII